MQILLLLLLVLLLPAPSAISQQSQGGLHLIVGYAIGQMELEGGRFREENYLTNGFATACAYQWDIISAGVKSIAMVGAHNRSEGLILSDGDVPLRRYIQHMSLTPFIGVRRDIAAELPFGLQFEIGPSRAISSFKHKDGYTDSEGLQRRKSSFESKGFELGLGLYQKPVADSRGLTVILSYQSLESQRQYLVDVTKFKQALTISKQRSRDVEKLEGYTLAFNFNLF